MSLSEHPSVSTSYQRELHTAYLARRTKMMAAKMGAELPALVSEPIKRRILLPKPIIKTWDRVWETIGLGLIPPVDRRVFVFEIIKACARHWDISVIDIKSYRRTNTGTKDIVTPRQVGMYLAKTLTVNSYPDIARRFGKANHTTIWHAVHKITALLAVDDKLRADVEAIKATLSHTIEAA